MPLLTGKQKQFVCKGCKNQSDAYADVSKLPMPAGKSDEVTVHDIVTDMYVPENRHIERLVKYGKKITVETMTFNRHCMVVFDKLWGTT